MPWYFNHQHNSMLRAEDCKCVPSPWQMWACCFCGYPCRNNEPAELARGIGGHVDWSKTEQRDFPGSLGLWFPCGGVLLWQDYSSNNLGLGLPCLALAWHRGSTWHQRASCICHITDTDTIIATHSAFSQLQRINYNDNVEVAFSVFTCGRFCLYCKHLKLGCVKNCTVHESTYSLTFSCEGLCMFLLCDDLLLSILSNLVGGGGQNRYSNSIYQEENKNSPSVSLISLCSS